LASLCDSLGVLHDDDFEEFYAAYAVECALAGIEPLAFDELVELMRQLIAEAHETAH
jgi:hypothetical protein